MSPRCATSRGRTRIDSEWLDYLNSVGFAEERRFLRMFLPGHVHPGIPERQYAICGPEFA